MNILDKFVLEVEDEDNYTVISKLRETIDKLTPEECQKILKEHYSFNSIFYTNKEIIIQKVIDKFDPMMLEPGDMAPEDEYDGESRRIAKKVETGMSVIEIAEVISKEMTTSFSTEHTIDECMFPAKEIHYLLNE